MQISDFIVTRKSLSTWKNVLKRVTYYYNTTGKSIKRKYEGIEENMNCGNFHREP